MCEHRGGARASRAREPAANEPPAPTPRASDPRLSLRFCVSAVKKNPYVIDVEPDLLREKGEVGVFLLVAELVQELDAHVPAVEVSVEIEQVDFQNRRALLPDRGPDAQARRAGQRLARRPVHLDCEY